jgi:hypothetical protein
MQQAMRMRIDGMAVVAQEADQGEVRAVGQRDRERGPSSGMPTCAAFIAIS